MDGEIVCHLVFIECAFGYYLRTLDIGRTVGVWAMNIIVGCLIGEVVVVWYILRAVFILVKYFMSVLK